MIFAFSRRNRHGLYNCTLNVLPVNTECQVLRQHWNNYSRQIPIFASIMPLIKKPFSPLSHNGYLYQHCPYWNELFIQDFYQRMNPTLKFCFHVIQYVLTKQLWNTGGKLLQGMLGSWNDLIILSLQCRNPYSAKRKWYFSWENRLSNLNLTAFNQRGKKTF